MSLTLTPTPKLVLKDGSVLLGINIIEHLYAIKDSDANSNAMFLRAIGNYRQVALPRLGFKLLAADAVMPTKRIIDVGFDLTIISVDKALTRITTLYDTSVAVEPPLGFYAEIVPRSSISKLGYMLANNVGVIDPSYTGSLKIALIKVDESMPDLELPCKVAQLILKPYVVSEVYKIADEMNETQRGDGGFGSTGPTSDTSQAIDL